MDRAKCGHLIRQSEHTSCVLSFLLLLVGLNPQVEVTYTMPARPQILQRRSIALSVYQKIYMQGTKNKSLQTTSKVIKTDHFLLTCEFHQINTPVKKQKALTIGKNLQWNW